MWQLLCQTVKLYEEVASTKACVGNFKKASDGFGEGGKVGDHRLGPAETPYRPSLGISVILWTLGKSSYTCFFFKLRRNTIRFFFSEKKIILTSYHGNLHLGDSFEHAPKLKDFIMHPPTPNFFKWQRAMTMRKVLQEILENNPRFHHLTPLKTKHIAHWCRCHGYTPPDPESLRSDGDSIEDVLTQIDSEPGKHSGWWGVCSAPSAAERCLLRAHAHLSASRALRPHQLQQVSELFPSPEVKGPEDSRGCHGEQKSWLASHHVSYPPPRTVPTKPFVPRCSRLCLSQECSSPLHATDTHHLFRCPPPLH